MELKLDCKRLCILALYIPVLATAFILSDARSSAVQWPNFHDTKLHENSISKLIKKLKVLSHNDNEPSLNPPNTKAYGLSSPFSIPPFDSIAPLPSPENIPPFCVNPPFTPHPPPTTLPSPVSYTLSPPPPSQYFTPNFPIQSPPPISPAPSHSPAVPNPPPPPCIFFPSPPNYVPSPPRHVPGPPVYQPPVVYPPPSVPPPPHKEAEVGTWCVAKPAVPDPIIQEAMDYACGSGANCDSIQPNGACYKPDTLVSHASYAFNSYWQSTKKGGGTCDFGGTAMLVTVDPSSNGCHFIHN